MKAANPTKFGRTKKNETLASMNNQELIPFCKGETFSKSYDRRH